MLELNKKEKGNINFIILVLVLYSIIALGVTFYLISIKNNKKDLSVNIKQEDIKENIKETLDYSKIERISLTDKYYINNIKIENKEEYAGDIISYSEDIPQYKVSITYPEISGLSNKKIEEKINTEIKNQIEILKDNAEILDSEINNMYISGDVMANFADVLSISIYKSNFLKNNDVTFKYIGLNFRLDTGEKLEFKDLFTEDASVKSIIARAAYKSLAFQYAVEQEDFDMYRNMDEFDYSEVENCVYKFMNSYNQNSHIEYYFNEALIYLYQNDSFITVDMIDFYEYINIYNIVKQNRSLYSNGNKEKINYVFGMPLFENYEYFDKISDNIFLSIYNGYKSSEDTTYNEMYTEYIKNYDKYKNRIVSSIKDYERENKNAVIYNIKYIDVNSEENHLLRAVAEKIEIDDLDKNLDEIYAKASRGDGMDGISFYNLNEEYKTYNVSINEKETGELEIIEESIVSYSDI